MGIADVRKSKKKKHWGGREHHWRGRNQHWGVEGHPKGIQIDTHGTRCYHHHHQQLKVAKQSTVSRVRRNHFGARVVSDWNFLAEDAICQPSMNAFKNGFD